jgi:hypothetical protein
MKIWRFGDRKPQAKANTNNTQELVGEDVKLSLGGEKRLRCGKRRRLGPPGETPSSGAFW